VVREEAVELVVGPRSQEGANHSRVELRAGVALDLREDRVLRPGGTLLLVTTRPSVPEAVLRLTWRYRTFNRGWLLHALTTCGLTRSRCYQVGRRPRIAQWLSLAFVGRESGETGSTAPGALGTEAAAIPRRLP
jgi:hypothetical protein